jgi:hypothetical protein
VASLTVNSATSATAVVNIAAGATVGSSNVTLTTGTEVVTLTNGFTVTAGTPVLTTDNPNTGQQGQQNLSVAITGQFTHFVQGTTTASFGTGITVASLTVNSATSATAVVNIAAGATVGSSNVTLTTGAEVVTLTNGFTVTAGTPVQHPTTLKFTPSSPTLLANGQPATFSTTLKEDGTTLISARSVTITMGSGAGSNSCTGTTNKSGTATCTIVVNQPLGPNTVAANFSGDAFYRPASDTEAVVVFAFPSSGSFVIGDLNAAVGNTVTFWGAQWAKVNSLSGGPAPAAFKGFADITSSAPPACGGTWTTHPGNSSGPPTTVAAFMAVIGSTSITKSGNTITGDVPEIVIVKTNPGYGPSPGQTGTGTVVAVFCGT